MITQIQAKKSYEASYLDIIKMESDMLMKHFSFVYDGHGGTHTQSLMKTTRKECQTNTFGITTDAIKSR